MKPLALLSATGLGALALGAALIAAQPAATPVASTSTGAAIASHAPILTLDAARAVMAAAESDALRKNRTGAIAIVDSGGHLVLLSRLDHTFPAAATVAEDKARSAAIFRKPTRDFEDSIRSGRAALLGVNVLTPLQGGVPIVIDGHVVGAIGVSGAASAQQDDEIAIAGAAAMSGVTR